MTPTENYGEDPPVKDDMNSDILKDVLGSNISTTSDKSGIKGNICDDDERSCGNFTNIEGVLIEVLEYIEKIKSTKNRIN